MAPLADSPDDIIVSPDNNVVSIEDSQGQTKKVKRAPKKIYIPIRIQTNALNNDDIAINAAYLSIEDLTDTTKKNKKSQDVEIRYLDSIRSFRDKIKSSYSCSQDHCPVIKERLDQHHMEHHQWETSQREDNRAEGSSCHPLTHCCSNDRHSQNILQETDQGSKGTVNKVLSADLRLKKSVAISPAASILKRSPIKCVKCQNKQNSLKCVDFNHTTQTSFETNLFSSDRQTQESHYERSPVDNEIVFTSRNTLRDDIQEEIKKWIEDIPIYHSLTPSLKNLRKNMINDFIDKIFDLTNDLTAIDFERNAKIEVENFLNALPMWYPGAKRDQNLLKESIMNNLMLKIKNLHQRSHTKKHTVKYVDDMVNTDVKLNLTENGIMTQELDDKEKIIESEVLDWLMQIKFKESEEIGRTINIIDATDIFTKRLMPLLDRPAVTKNYKLILKGLIVDTLNDLPNILHYPKNKRCYLNRISEDLANRLICMQSKYKTHFSCVFPRERSMYQLAICSKSNLKQSLMNGLNDCLQSMTLNQKNDVKEEITDILIDCLESVRFKEDLEDKNDLINNVLGKHSVEMSETQTSDITIENVRDFLASDIMNNAEYTNKDIRSCQSGIMSVFTSEHELSGKYLVTSTPITQDKKRFNDVELVYIERLNLLIINWMDTLPRQFNKEEEKKFKEIIAIDLAKDIIDQLKLEQLAPKTTPDRDKFMFYIIFRWLFKFDVTENLNEATPYIDDLVKRLHEIPVPVLNKPQRLNRDMKHMEDNYSFTKELRAISIEVLKDAILIWINEQPPEIYSIQDKDQQNQLVYELAHTVKDKIQAKTQENELNNALSKWLKIMLKSAEKNNIEMLCRNLKNRLLKSFTDPDTTQRSKNNNAILQKDISKSVIPQGMETSPDNQNTKLDQKDTISNSWYNYKYPKDIKDNRTTESNHDGKLSQNTQKDKHKLKAPSGTAAPSDYELSQGSSENMKNRKNAKNNQRTLANITIESIHSNASSSSKDMITSGSETSQNPNITKSDDMSQLQRNLENNKNNASSSCNCRKDVQTGYDQNKKEAKSICTCPSGPNESEGHQSATSSLDTGNDGTLIEIISKYMEHNSDVDDNVTKSVFEKILKSEIQKMNPPTRQAIYDEFAKRKLEEENSPERLDKELQYIKDISDWLKNIPIETCFNTPQNKERIEFVNNLAKDIYEVEDNRRNEPSAMDYNAQLLTIITQYTEKLPILPEQTANVFLMVEQLASKIRASRTPMPCCMNTSGTASSFDTTGMPEQNLSEFIDHYIRLNAGEIANDPVKLDAWSARVLKEAKKIVRDSAEPSSLCKAQIYDKLGNISIPEEASIRIFGLELDYAKEISEWLNNLPLLPITTSEASEQRVRMISELAEKFAEGEKKKIIDPTDESSYDNLEEYISTWIQKLPLESKREIVMSLVIQQLLKRIERVRKGPPDTLDQSTNTPKTAKSKAKPKVSKSCRPSCCSSGKNAGQLMIEAIESWSNSLPIKADNKDAEKHIKDGVARKLFQKVGDLSVDPQVMNDDFLYQEILSDEVDQQLDLLPQSSDLNKKKENLRKNLVDKVMEAKNFAKESAAGETYKQKLETTIDASIPNPVFKREVLDPGFEIYKNRLAEIFILENFDHGTDEVKLKYEKRIKKEIDKYCQDAQMKNAMPLSKEQIYSELYSALFKVPIPGESSTTDEVEEVKTRCEVADWFEGLPLQEASGPDEFVRRDNIQSILAKRLKEIEKKEQHPEKKMHKEITKWVRKLPLLPGYEEKTDILANDLQKTLKSTKEDRKRVPFTNTSLSKKKSKTKGILGTSQVAGPSSAGHMWSSPPQQSQVCCQEQPIPVQKAADIILEIVENWCKSLPFYENTQKSRDINKVIREDLGTKIIIKICELNGDPRVFSDDLLYNCLLDEELDKLMTNLPICCDFEPTKNYKKAQLKEALNSVKILIREERECHEYKKDLDATVNNILKEPLDNTADKIDLFNELREEIVDNFVQYHYNRDDDEGRQIYKAKLRDAVLKYFLEIQNKPDETGMDALMKQNLLLCELSKISIPGERSIKNEVNQIRMKEEVGQFLEELSLKQKPEGKNTTVNNIKVSLAKRLNEIEKTGHNCTNDAKMKKEISRYLRKLGADVGGERIEKFVENLKATEAARKASPNKRDDNYCHGSKDLNRSIGSYQNQNVVPNAPLATNNSRNTYNLQAESKLCCPQAFNNSRSLGVTPVEYQGFGGGVALSSSPQTDVVQPSQPQEAANVCPNRNQVPITGTEPTNQGERPGGPYVANKNKRQTTSNNNNNEEECKCLTGKGKRKMNRKPKCVLRRSQFCDDCDDYGPMWMPFPSFRHPPGYFYF